MRSTVKVWPQKQFRSAGAMNSHQLTVFADNVCISRPSEMSLRYMDVVGEFRHATSDCTVKHTWRLSVTSTGNKVNPPSTVDVVKTKTGQKNWDVLGTLYVSLWFFCPFLLLYLPGWANKGGPFCSGDSYSLHTASTRD